MRTVHFSITFSKLHVVLAIIVLFFIATITTTIIVHADNATGIIYACIRPNDTIRILDKNDQCKSNETAIEWNVQGPQGPAGPQGPQGPAGSSGGKIICPGCNFTEEVPNEFSVFPSKNLDGSYLDFTQWNNGIDMSSFSAQNAYFDSSSFINSNLANINLNGTQLRGSNFSGAKLTNAIFTGVNASYFDNSPFGKGFVATNFSGVDATGANFAKANLTGYIDPTYGPFLTNFNGATLRNVDFTDAHVDYADFTNADLTGATFTGATITNDTFGNTTCPDGSNSGTGKCPGFP